MDDSTRVCPHCGEPPGDGVFCAACGRNLAAVERLPTRAEFEHRGAMDTTAIASATAAFLDAMRAAGNPGTTRVDLGKPAAFRRRRAEGWVVRPVEREDLEGPRRYEPGLFLTVEGRFHRLDSDLRGWGQRDFPQYQHRLSPEPVVPPAEQRLLDELAALQADRGR